MSRYPVKLILHLSVIIAFNIFIILLFTFLFFIFSHFLIPYYLHTYVNDIIRNGTHNIDYLSKVEKFSISTFAALLALFYLSMYAFHYVLTKKKVQILLNEFEQQQSLNPSTYASRKKSFHKLFISHNSQSYILVKGGYRYLLTALYSTHQNKQSNSKSLLDFRHPGKLKRSNLDSGNKGDSNNPLFIDPLTGIGNRVKLLHDIESAENAGVAFYNMSNFSEVNRFYSHSEGDRILKSIARELLRESALIYKTHKITCSTYRVYADTFAIMIDDQPVHMFSNFAISIFSILSTVSLSIHNDISDIKFRMGAALRGKESYVYADISLDIAKRSRSGYYIYSEQNSTNIVTPDANIRMLNIIKTAIQADLIFPVFQPIVDISSGIPTKYECLIRMKDESGNLLSPGDFINISKKTGWYQQLTIRLINKAFSYFQSIDYDFSINLTIEDLTNNKTMKHLLTLANSTGISQRLIIEIVESEEFNAYDGSLSIIEELHKNKIRIAIDDFGSGYSNFDYLIKMNPSYIKIDSTITTKLLSDDRATKLVRSIVSFAKESGIKTIAEHIDSPLLLEKVRELEIDFGQGWYLGKPAATIA